MESRLIKYGSIRVVEFLRERLLDSEAARDNTDIATLESINVVDVTVNRTTTVHLIAAAENGIDPDMDATILSVDMDHDLRQKIDKHCKMIDLCKFIRKYHGNWRIILNRQSERNLSCSYPVGFMTMVS